MTMSEQSTDGSERVGKREQVGWANDCNDIRVLAKSAEAAVRRENYEKAHQKLAELSDQLDSVREEYPRYIHAETDQ